MIVDIIPAKNEHIEVIASDMRQADADEVFAASMMSPADALQVSLDGSPFAWTGTVDGVPVCMFGVSSECVLTLRGVPWLLAARSLERYQAAFLRRCRAFLQRMLAIYPVLVNYVDVRNVVSMRWLRWMGFTFDDPAPFGPFGLPFARFEMRRAAV